MAKYKPGEFQLHVRRASAGRGLFAGEDIPKGVCVIEYVGRPLNKQEEEESRSKYLFAIDEKRTIDGKPRDNLAGYINHSCRPNCEPEIYRGRVYIFSKRKIRAGEELNYNYGKEYFTTFIEPYGCRCVKCKGVAPAKYAAVR
ncbi:MAG: SET domain-containing protein [Hyphomonadaceae bacterium]